MYQDYRRIPLDGMHNTRDLGGYPARGGRMTQYRRFLRSDMPWKLSELDADMLRGMGLSFCIDLRSPEEWEKYPHYFEDDPSVEVRHIYFMQGMRNEYNSTGEYTSMGDLYIDMADNVREKIKEVFESVAEAPEGMLMLNCTAGKDRTGLNAAMLLAACGVDYLDVISDYMVSEIYNRRIMQHINTVAPEVNLMYHRSEPHNIERLFEHIGGAEKAGEYLLECGLSQSDLDRVVERMLAE